MLSFVVPVYNAKRYVRRCINSLLENTDELKDIEIIIIDDGSTDGSAEICQQLVQSDDRIKYLCQPNSGASAARNVGIKCAKGQYISFIDADDYVEHGYLRELLATVCMDQADMYVFGYKVVKEEKVLSIVKCPVESGIYATSEVAHVYGKYGDNTVWNKIFKKSILESGNIQFNVRKRIGEDFQFIQDYMFVAEYIAMKNYSGYFYNLNDGSVVANTKLSCFNDNADTLSRTVKYIEQFGLGKDFEEKFCAFMRSLTIESIKALIDKGESITKIKSYLESSQILDLLLNDRSDGIQGMVERYLLKKHRFYVIWYFYVPFTHLMKKILKKIRKKKK